MLSRFESGPNSGSTFFRRLGFGSATHERVVGLVGGGGHLTFLITSNKINNKYIALCSCVICNHNNSTYLSLVYTTAYRKIANEQRQR